MGARGKKYLRLHHKKALSPRRQTKDAGWGNPAHPLRIRRGMRFWPRAGKRKHVIEIRTVQGDTAHALRLSGDRGPVRLTTARLLEVRDDGQGRHYQFCGYKPGRYSTYAYVHSIDGRHAILVVPNWHAARPVTFPAALIPAQCRVAGAWMRCHADLGAPSAAALNLARLRSCAPPAPDVCHSPAYTPKEPAGASALLAG